MNENSDATLDSLLDEAYSDESPVETPEEELTPSDENPTPTDESPQVDLEAEEPVDKIFLEDFSRDTEVDIADVYQLSVPLGEELGDESISELKDFRVQNADIVAKRQELEDKEKDLVEREDQFRDVPKVSNELMQARAKVMSIQDQYNNTNWDELRVQNVAEWTARQQEFQMAFSAAKQEEQLATQTVETQAQQARQFAQDRLFEAMPELKDETARQEAGIRVQKFASRYGFTARDIANIDNPNLMRLLIDVSKLDVAKEQAKQKMRDKTPKTAKPGKTKPIASTRKVSLDKLKQRAMTGSKKDRDKFIDALLT